MATRARRGREAAAGERRVIRGAGGSGWVSKCRGVTAAGAGGRLAVDRGGGGGGFLPPYTLSARSYRESAGCWGQVRFIQELNAKRLADLLG